MKARVRVVHLPEEECYQGGSYLRAQKDHSNEDNVALHDKGVDPCDFDPIRNVAAMVVSGSDHVRDTLAEKLGLLPDERESFNEMVARSRDRLQRGVTESILAHVGIARVLDM